MVQHGLEMNEIAGHCAAPIDAGVSVRCEKVSPAPRQIADPLFILSAPRSFSSVVCAMLGQHPQMYGLPEMHLFGDERLEGWFRLGSGDTLRHGLLRAVTQLCFGAQTERNVKLADAWLKRRSSFTSGMIFEELALRAAPAILVDKSPSMVYSLEAMQRAYRFFPQARFIHLARHPRGHGQSVLKYLQELGKPEYRIKDAIPAWIDDLASFSYSPAAWEGEPKELKDPQCGWYVLNRNIATFLKSVPPQQWMVLRGEDLLREADRGLRQVARWLGLRTDTEAIEEMKHPERSPYSRFGPRGAGIGNDMFFLKDPVLRPARGDAHSLEGPLDWRKDGMGFLPEVKELAQRLGYR
jgi:hypothetical protein